MKVDDIELRWVYTNQSGNLNVQEIYYNDKFLGSLIERYPNFFDFKGKVDTTISKYVLKPIDINSLLKGIDIIREILEHEYSSGNCYYEIIIDGNDKDFGLNQLIDIENRLSKIGDKNVKK